MDSGKYKLNAKENLIFLPRDREIAEAAKMAIHETNHKPSETAQIAIFEKFGTRQTPSGLTYLDLMEIADKDLSPEELVLKRQVFNQVEQLALDVRDYTNKAILSGDSVLTTGDPKYAALSPADAAGQWQADIDRLFGSGPEGFEVGRQNLWKYRKCHLNVRRRNAHWR